MGVSSGVLASSQGGAVGAVCWSPVGAGQRGWCAGLQSGRGSGGSVLVSTGQWGRCAGLQSGRGSGGGVLASSRGGAAGAVCWPPVGVGQRGRCAGLQSGWGSGGGVLVSSRGGAAEAVCWSPVGASPTVEAMFCDGIPHLVMHTAFTVLP